MNKVFFSKLLITLFCVVSSFAACAESITIGTTEYSPFTTKESKHGGFVNRIITEAFKRKGVTVTYKYLPWKRALELGKSGKIAAVSFSFANKDREQDFIFSNTLSEHRELLFHLKSESIPDWNSITDLDAFTFGATRGYTYTPQFWSAAKAGALKVQETNNDEQNFKKLGSKRIQLFPMDEITGWNLVNSTLPTLKDILTTHDKALRSTTGHLIISRKYKDNDRYLKAINESIAEMRKDGTYDKYLDDLLTGKY